MEKIFFDLTVIICIAAVLSVIFRILKQPSVLAYILTGMLVAPFQFFHSANEPLLLALSQVGVTLLLFMVGLEIRISELLSLGKVIILVSLAQISITYSLVFIISTFLGFDPLSSLYIALGLTFSSTIIVVKLLSDQHELHSLHAKFALGILLIQDVLAILFLMFLSGVESENVLGPLGNFALVLVKGALLIGLIVLLSRTIFPKIIDRVSTSSETLFLASLAWVFGLAALVSSKLVGFSIEIGGFLAGVALANSFANYQIIAKAKILRDFFIVIFFVLLGIRVSFSHFNEIIVPTILLSLFVLFVKPFIVMLSLGALGYRKRTSFLTGVSISQLSEFSLIIAFLGLTLGHIDQKVASIITSVGLVTFATSTYGITHWKNLYKLFSKHMSFIEKKDIKKEESKLEETLENLKDHVVVIGGDQMGMSIIEALDSDESVVIVDFDPSVVKRFENKKVFRLFGDISDLDIQQRAKLDDAKLVISTIPDVDDNLSLLKELKHENRRAKVVVMALDSKDAASLYQAGADYVVLPHLAGGRQIAKLLSHDGYSQLEKLREEDKKYLT